MVSILIRFERSGGGRWCARGPVLGVFLALAAGSCVENPPARQDTPIEAETGVLAAVPVGTAPVPYSRISTVAIPNEDTACTIDSYAVKVHCVNRRADVVGVFGSEGSGPGEFLRPTRLVRGEDGTIGVADGARTRLLVFEPSGAFVRETRLPGALFIPASPFGSTVTGTYARFVGPSADISEFIGTMVAVEMDTKTGEVLREWRPPNIPVFDECGMPNFLVPTPTDGWVFVGCSGHLAFMDAFGGTRFLQAPAYSEELPSERDVSDRLEIIRRFRESLGSAKERPSVSDIPLLEAYRQRFKLYYLLRGQETFDERGRLWIATRRDRDEFSYLDVYANAGFVGSVRVRDRIIDFDVMNTTLVVLVERKAGPDDPDGVPDREIDWYDISEL